jgi:hypothetical protein
MKPIPTKKVCKICKEEKDITSFYKVSFKHYRRNTCIPCMSVIQGANYIKRKSLAKTKS